MFLPVTQRTLTGRVWYIWSSKIWSECEEVLMVNNKCLLCEIDPTEASIDAHKTSVSSIDILGIMTQPINSRADVLFSC